MADLKHKEQLVAAGLEMASSGLTVETWGNISLRDFDTGLVYLTPSAMDYSAITPADVVVCDGAGNVVDGHRKPTVEKDLHLMLYKARPEVGAIVHTHPIYSLIFGVLDRPIPPIIDEAAQILLDEIPVAPYGLAGSIELAQNCVDTFGKTKKAVVLKSHGTVCIGRDLKEAFRVARVTEMTAEVYYKACLLGTPAAIAPENLAAMKHMMEAYFAANQ